MSKADPSFEAQVERLQQLTVYSRWLVVSLLWLSIGSLSVWSLRFEVQMLREYFTWAAVRYALIDNPWAAFGLFFCIGNTTAVLVWQSRNILFGLPQQERQRLEKSVIRIRQQGPSHPLWKWISQ